MVSLIVISRYLRYFSRCCGTAIHRDLADTVIVTFGITILTEVSQVSHKLQPSQNIVRDYHFLIVSVSRLL